MEFLDYLEEKVNHTYKYEDVLKDDFLTLYRLDKVA